MDIGMDIDMVKLTIDANNMNYMAVEARIEEWRKLAGPKSTLEQIFTSIHRESSRQCVAGALAHVAAECGDLDVINFMVQSNDAAILSGLQTLHPGDGRTPKQRATYWARAPVVSALERHEQPAQGLAVDADAPTVALAQTRRETAANARPHASAHYLEVPGPGGAASAAAQAGAGLAGAGPAGARRARAPEP